MKVITEDILRNELRTDEPEFYCIPEGKILSPAAREYLQQRKIKVLSTKEKIAKDVKIEATAVPPMPTISAGGENHLRFVDYETGAYYLEKPEHMTHLYGNVLVVKNHPRIVFRGKLDSLQSLFVLNQATLAEKAGNTKLIADLSELLNILREMMRCDVLDVEFKNETLLGLNHAQLREHSHDPMKFYNIKQMILPDYTIGKEYALLNQLRTAIRETEVAGTNAFHDGKKYSRLDIIEELNRMSSAMHIMMCKYLAGDYNA